MKTTLTTFTVFATLALAACQPSETDQKAALQNTAQQYGQSIVSRNKTEFLRHSDPELFKFIHSKDSKLTVEQIKDMVADGQLQQKEVIIESAEAGTPGDIQVIAGQKYCFVPLTHVASPDYSGKHFSQIPLFGPKAVKLTIQQLFVSKDGKKWVTAGISDREALEDIYPQIKGKLLFPSPMSREEIIR